MDERPGGQRWAAGAVWLLSWACSGAAVLLLVAHDLLGRLGAEDVGFFTDGTYFTLDVVMGLVNAPAAALVLARSRHVVGWLLALVALGFSGAALALAWALVAVEHPGLPGLGLAAHAFSWWWMPGAFMAVTVMPWLLRDHAPSTRVVRWAAVGAGLSVLVALGAAVQQQPGAPENPLSPHGTLLRPTLAGTLDLLLQAGVLALAVVGVAAVLDLVRRWRRESEASRRALGAVALSLAVLIASFATLQFYPDVPSRGLVELVAVPALFGSQVLMPFAIVVLVLRSRMWGVDAAVSRAAVWALLTTVVVALYVAVVWAVVRVLPVDDETAGLVAAAVLALAVQPLRQWLQRRIDRLVYGVDSDPVALLARFGEQLRGGAGGALPALVEGLRRGLRLGAVEVVTPDPREVRARAGTPGRAGPALPTDRRVPDSEVTLPLVVDGRHLGDLVLHAVPGERLDLRTVRLVRRLSEVIGVALDLALTNERLEAASERLGEVRLQERRMLRRELHDGLGPALAGVGLGLAAARRQLDRDPAAADALLAELGVELDRRTDDLRLLARAVLPAQLDDGDLVAALRVLAARFASSGLTVHTDVRADAGVLDARRQIAIYHVAAEALLNAHRHAQAGRVQVTVTTAGDGGAVLEVVDDGRGIAADRGHGVGLRSMRERADELAGRLDLGPGPGGRGTTVRLELPPPVVPHPGPGSEVPRVLPVE